MAANIKPGYLLSQEDYAQVYGVHINTINRWQKRKLPVDDPQSLMRRLFSEDFNRALKTFSKGRAKIIEHHAQKLSERKLVDRIPSV